MNTRKTGLIAVALLLISMLASCSYYHRATVQGYVEDEETEVGINSATVRFYMEKPAEPDEEGFFARTSTANSGGNPGFYNNTVIWDSYFRDFGAEGDTGTIFLGVTHPDYLARIVEVPGVLSDDVNTLETIALQRVTFAAGEVYGRITKETDGSGVNGVRMVLTVPDLDAGGNATEEENEYIVQTADRNGEAGWYSFDEPSWRDESTEPGSSSEVSARLEVDDDDWEADKNPAITLTSTQDIQVEDDLAVNRAPREEFQTTLTGRVYYKPPTDDEYRGLQGVEVTITYTAYTDPEGERTVAAETGPDGEFTAQVPWERDNEVYAGAPDSAPEGEDVLGAATEGEEILDELTVTYQHSEIADADEDQDREQIRSWIDPNRMEDLYVN